MSVLPVTIFSDFTCPYSYVTEAALRDRLTRRGDIEVRYRALERYPAPVPPVPPAEQTDWQAVTDPVARALQLTLRAPGFCPRTRKAHETARFAEARGAGGAMRDALFAAYWGEERDIGRIDVLQELAAGLDLDPTDLKIALDIDRHRDEVEQDLQLAARLRVPALPTLFLGTGAEARVLVGVQGPAALDAALASG